MDGSNKHERRLEKIRRLRERGRRHFIVWRGSSVGVFLLRFRGRSEWLGGQQIGPFLISLRWRSSPFPLAVTSGVCSCGHGWSDNRNGRVRTILPNKLQQQLAFRAAAEQHVRWQGGLVEELRTRGQLSNDNRSDRGQRQAWL